MYICELKWIKYCLNQNKALYLELWLAVMLKVETNLGLYSYSVYGEMSACINWVAILTKRGLSTWCNLPDQPCSLPSPSTRRKSVYSTIYQQSILRLVRGFSFQALRLLSVWNALTVTTLWENSVYDKFVIFLLFFQKIDFDSPCKLSPETSCMKCQSLVSGKIRNYFKLLSAEILPSMLGAKQIRYLWAYYNEMRSFGTTCVAPNKTLF